jgi:hypothetical protein
MKKIIVFIVVLALAIGSVWYIKNKTKVSVDSTVKSYKNSNLGISFTYPINLTASTTNSVVTLHHDIPYENHGDCDMVGDTKTYPRLTDFNVKIQKINKGVVDAMKTISPYIPQENFVNGEVIVSPGFIDAFKAGNLDGYAIYEGAEGCGQTTYYFPITNDETLVINKMSIQVLSGSIRVDEQAKVLAVPGVIPRDESDKIFASILNTLKVQ